MFKNLVDDACLLHIVLGMLDKVLELDVAADGDRLVGTKREEINHEVISPRNHRPCLRCLTETVNIAHVRLFLPQSVSRFHQVDEMVARNTYLGDHGQVLIA